MGYVYLIGSPTFGWYKIGKSRTPNIRIRQLGILLPFKIEVLAVWKANNYHLLEATLHEQFESFQINGEWFRLSRTQISELISSVPNNTAQSQLGKFSNIERDAPDGQRIKLSFSPDISDEERECRKQKGIAERLYKRANTPRCSSCGGPLKPTPKVPLENPVEVLPVASGR